MKIAPFIKSILSALHLRPVKKAKAAPTDTYSALIKLSDQKVNYAKLKPEDLLNHQYRPRYHAQRKDVGARVMRPGGETIVVVQPLTLKQRRIYK